MEIMSYMENSFQNDENRKEATKIVANPIIITRRRDLCHISIHLFSLTLVKASQSSK